MKKIIAPAAAVLLLAACSAPTSEDATADACDAFAYYLEDAGSPEAMVRQTTVEQVAVELEDKPAPADGITDALGAMRNGVDASEGAWMVGADMMASACQDAGWTP